MLKRLLGGLNRCVGGKDPEHDLSLERQNVDHIPGLLPHLHI